MKTPVTILQQPVLKPAEDYYRLRREGIGFIEQAGSQLWTDYNTHDPGITILEALCYALTDLAYRTGWDIKDLLAPANKAADKHQPFFTARNILTVNPVTPDDLRRLLIDLQEIRNAWVFCQECAGDFRYYAWCEDGQLKLSYQRPDNPQLQPQAVAPRGFYEVLLELEADPELGDLNGRKLEHIHYIDGQPITMELRFPSWNLAQPENEQRFSNSTGEPAQLQRTKFSRSKTDDRTISDDELRQNWHNVFYLSFEIETAAGDQKIRIENAALRVFGDQNAKNLATVVKLTEVLENKTASGFIQRYRKKLAKTNAAVASAKAKLQTHRNLDEDFGRVAGVAVEEVSVCADVEVTPDADIELVQAQIWFALEQYCNPLVRFSTLPELLAEGVPVEEIFNGPALDNGFIKAQDLAAAQLKSVLRVSDILNLLMDIEGVVAVNNMLLAKYDAEGNVVNGAADPTWHNGQPVFDTHKSSPAWLLYVSPRQQPRFYRSASRFLFYKNGLPFSPRRDEARATLLQLRGATERPKWPGATHDLLVPAGTFRDPQDYAPVQYSFPLAYGVGPEGVPTPASLLRRAQARQLKAYLMVFEQLLGNALAQLAHTADLFSLAETIKRTYFVREFSKEIIAGYDEIIAGLDQTKLEEMTETEREFQARRNRFLDHLLARFGEQFASYPLLHTNAEGKKVSPAQLVTDKIAFLRDYPAMSRERGRADGLQRRLSRLLPELKLEGAGCIVVEHLRLCPKFPGDALFPTCTEGVCAICGDEDPYSFRLTLVLPGWQHANLDLRRFADRTIGEEIPAHLLAKTCWVSEDDFTAFAVAWNDWAQADKGLDWTEERLAECVEAVLREHLATAPGQGDLCRCASDILAKFGQDFYQWMESNIAEGRVLENFTVFQPAEVTLCAGYGFKPETAARITTLLTERYDAYKEVSCRLWRVLNLLGQLHNVYPPATLHDCDDSSDDNPVRLGQTALGEA